MTRPPPQQAHREADNSKKICFVYITNQIKTLHKNQTKNAQLFDIMVVQNTQRGWIRTGDPRDQVLSSGRLEEGTPLRHKISRTMLLDPSHIVDVSVSIVYHTAGAAAVGCNKHGVKQDPLCFVVLPRNTTIQAYQPRRPSAGCSKGPHSPASRG